MASNTYRSIQLVAMLLATIILQLSAQENDTNIDDLISSIFSENATGPVDVTRVGDAEISKVGDSEGPKVGDTEVTKVGDSEVPKVGDAEVTRLGETENPCPAGECVPYYLCANGSVITSGEGILDVRLGADDDPEPEMHPCKEFFDTCCLVRTENDEKIIRPVQTREKCGFRNDNGVGFEIKPRDLEAQFAEFPWAVALLHKKDMFDVTLSVYQCGASLIHPSVVLTTAHCVYKKQPNEFTARAGEWDTQRTTEPFPHVDSGVVDILIHENFKPGSLFNDIALLFLETPFELAPHINTACLPLPDTTYDHQRCFANGWGKDKFDKGAYQAIMKRVELPVIPRDECQKRLRETRLGRFFILDRSFMCAGGERGIDTCTGDGGSPLVCKIAGTDNQYHQVGMVAWGVGCGDVNPGVYVNVPKFRPWIDAAFAARQLDTKYYIP